MYGDVYGNVYVYGELLTAVDGNVDVYVYVYGNRFERIERIERIERTSYRTKSERALSARFHFLR